MEYCYKVNESTREMYYCATQRDIPWIEGSSIKRKILVVDDTSDVTLTFKVILKKAGFRVDTFNDPTEALAHYRPGTYDLILIDIRMPKMNGYELYKRISEIDPNSLIRFITAFEIYDDEFRKLVPDVDPKWFLREPIAMDELIKVVNSLLKLRRR